MSHRRVTSLEVARRAGVSRTTVSFVLNGVQSGKVSDETRRKVLEAARELGYVPDAAARTLVSGKTRTIALVVSRADHISIDAFIPQTLHSLTRLCRHHGYRLLIETAENGQSTYDYDQLVGAKRIDGLVVVNPKPDDQLRNLIDRGYPIALIGAYPHPGAATVSVDSTLAMDQVTTHLIGLGHQRIGFIHYRHIRSMDAGGRFAGYRAALERAHLHLDERWVRSGDYSAESGYEAMRSLLAGTGVPTAIVAGNDTIAVGAMAAIVESGRRIPEDIAIVGFDDIPHARFMTPPLTTVRVPALEMAEACGTMLLRMIDDGPLEDPRRVFQTEMIVRQSCGTAIVPKGS
jgi:DNA-binding LacI/PurR family transcriptional regulator